MEKRDRWGGKRKGSNCMILEVLPDATWVNYYVRRRVAAMVAAMNEARCTAAVVAAVQEVRRMAAGVVTVQEVRRMAAVVVAVQEVRRMAAGEAAVRSKRAREGEAGGAPRESQRRNHLQRHCHARLHDDSTVTARCCGLCSTARGTFAYGAMPGAGGAANYKRMWRFAMGAEEDDDG